MAKKARVKTQKTKDSVAEFIASVADDRRRADAKAIDKMLREVTGEQLTGARSRRPTPGDRHGCDPIAPLRRVAPVLRDGRLRYSMPSLRESLAHYLKILISWTAKRKVAFDS